MYYIVWNEKNYKNKIEELFQNNDLLIFDKNYTVYDINLWINNSKIKKNFSNFQYTLKSRIIPKFVKVKKKIFLDIINKFTAELLDDGLVVKSIKDILIIFHRNLKMWCINIHM